MYVDKNGVKRYTLSDLQGWIGVKESDFGNVKFTEDEIIDRLEQVKEFREMDLPMQNSIINWLCYRWEDWDTHVWVVDVPRKRIYNEGKIEGGKEC